MAYGSGDLEEQLARREIVVTTVAGGHDDLPPLLTFAVVDAPPDKVFALIDDCSAYPRFIPRVLSASERQRQGHHSVCTMRIDMPAPMDDRTSTMAITRILAPAKWRREFKHIEGDFERNDGYWQLTPFGAGGEQTRVEYRLHSAFKTSLPSAILRVSQRGAMRDLMVNLRKQLEKQG
jgi:ribosome-associated toxin RatA of RatAB toxin-antitoxin module